MVEEVLISVVLHLVRSIEPFNGFSLLIAGKFLCQMLKMRCFASVGPKLGRSVEKHESKSCSLEMLLGLQKLQKLQKLSWLS